MLLCFIPFYCSTSYHIISYHINVNSLFTSGIAFLKSIHPTHVQIVFIQHMYRPLYTWGCCEAHIIYCLYFTKSLNIYIFIYKSFEFTTYYHRLVPSRMHHFADHCPWESNGFSYQIRKGQITFLVPQSSKCLLCNVMYIP